MYTKPFLKVWVNQYYAQYTGPDYTKTKNGNMLYGIDILL